MTLIKCYLPKSLLSRSEHSIELYGSIKTDGTITEIFINGSKTAHKIGYLVQKSKFDDNPTNGVLVQIDRNHNEIIIKRLPLKSQPSTKSMIFFYDDKSHFCLTKPSKFERYATHYLKKSPVHSQFHTTRVSTLLKPHLPHHYSQSPNTTHQ